MNHTRQMALTALFAALILLFGMTPVGLIPLGFINVTILCVPVVAGTMLLGLKTGVLLGACFGAVSVLAMFGLSLTAPSALAGALAAANPLLAIVMSVVPRLTVPVVTHFAYKALARGKEKNVKAVPIAAAAGSLTNTVLYLGLMLLFYTLVGLDNAKILTLIAGTGLIAGGSEAAVAAIISSAALAAIWKIPVRNER